MYAARPRGRKEQRGEVQKGPTKGESGSPQECSGKECPGWESEVPPETVLKPSILLSAPQEPPHLSQVPQQAALLSGSHWEEYRAVSSTRGEGQLCPGQPVSVSSQCLTGS